VRQFTAAVRRSACIARLSTRDQQRLAYYLAEAESDHAMAARAGTQLLAAPEYTGAGDAARVMAGTMASLMALGEARQALDTWQNQRVRIDPPVYPMILRLTIAQALAAASTAPASPVPLRIPGAK
jgi:hypothetical protein